MLKIVGIFWLREHILVKMLWLGEVVKVCKYEMTLSACIKFVVWVKGREPLTTPRILKSLCFPSFRRNRAVFTCCLVFCCDGYKKIFDKQGLWPTFKFLFRKNAYSIYGIIGEDVQDHHELVNKGKGQRNKHNVIYLNHQSMSTLKKIFSWWVNFYSFFLDEVQVISSAALTVPTFTGSSYKSKQTICSSAI